MIVRKLLYSILRVTTGAKPAIAEDSLDTQAHFCHKVVSARYHVPSVML
jgi:hypothetical protein